MPTAFEVLRENKRLFPGTVDAAFLEGCVKDGIISESEAAELMK